MSEQSQNLVLSALSVAYGQRPILRDISLAPIAPGSLVGVLGPNGVGKSTLMRALARLLPASGHAQLGSADLLHGPHREHMRTVSYLPQLLPQPTALLVYEAISGALRATRPELDSTDYDARLWRVSANLQLQDLIMQPLNRLSGGQRQMVGLAQVLVRQTRLMLLDEPTSALDLRWQMLALGAVHAAVKASDGIALIALHDINLALRFCDRIVVLGEGTVLADGHSEVVDAELLHRAYRVKARCEATASGERVVLVDGCA